MILTGVPAKTHRAKGASRHVRSDPVTFCLCNFYLCIVSLMHEGDYVINACKFSDDFDVAIKIRVA